VRVGVWRRGRWDGGRGSTAGSAGSAAAWRNITSAADSASRLKKSKKQENRQKCESRKKLKFRYHAQSPACEMIVWSSRGRKQLKVKSKKYKVKR